MSEQPTLRLNDGTAMPQFGLGVWRTPAEPMRPTVVKDAIAAGYRAVDTATVYGNEEGVGEALADHGPMSFLTTKLWNSDQGFDATLRAFEASTKAAAARGGRPLPHPLAGAEEGTLRRNLEGADPAQSRRAGPNRFGVSNFNPDHLQNIVGRDGRRAGRQSDRAASALPAARAPGLP